jgi:hypothetical protein
MTEKRTAAEIAEDLKVGAENRLIDQDFAKWRKELEDKLEELQKKLRPIRTKVEFGDHTEETYQAHEEIVHEMLEVEVEKLFLCYAGSDVVEEVAFQWGAQNIPEDEEETLSNFKEAYERGLND